MRAVIYKIITDREGASRITFEVPSSEMVNVVKLHTCLERELDLEINEHTDNRGLQESPGSGEVLGIST